MSNVDPWLTHAHTFGLINLKANQVLPGNVLWLWVGGYSGFQEVRASQG